MGPKSKIKKDKIEPKNDLGMENMKNYGRRRKRNLTFNLLDPNQQLETSQNEVVFHPIRGVINKFLCPAIIRPECKRLPIDCAVCRDISQHLFPNTLCVCVGPI